MASDTGALRREKATAKGLRTRLLRSSFYYFTLSLSPPPFLCFSLSPFLPPFPPSSRIKTFLPEKQKLWAGGEEPIATRNNREKLEQLEEEQKVRCVPSLVRRPPPRLTCISQPWRKIRLAEVWEWGSCAPSQVIECWSSKLCDCKGHNNQVVYDIVIRVDSTVLLWTNIPQNLCLSCRL